ncbi:hypothetical protein E3N88_33337 [Mikania micrantha]|uniref:4a-hydroxytetrahydrobiopterin dehydratase n=1 Tax=Mikania micrantha TaxID=192012 RepID=A0A5N6MBN9_9ASTR|nr:hypothetical protein E3N88_33337 [Mikania micrantha]
MHTAGKDSSSSQPEYDLRSLVPLKSSALSLFRSHGRLSSCAAPDVVELSLHRTILSGFRAFCSSKGVCGRGPAGGDSTLGETKVLFCKGVGLGGGIELVVVVNLSLRKCVPCNRKDLSPITEGNASVLKPQVPEWELFNDGGVMKLRRKWKVKNFLLGLEFFKIVADLAESEGHHPDLHLVGWNNVVIEIWTHACGGLTENDFILAAKIDKLPFESYLRRKVND